MPLIGMVSTMAVLLTIVSTKPESVGVIISYNLKRTKFTTTNISCACTNDSSIRFYFLSSCIGIK